MPQFDITTYSSQVFWFAICFAIFYYFVSSKILPRIRDILKERQTVINEDLSSASFLEKEGENFLLNSENLRTQVTSQYQKQIDETSKTAARKREDAIENLKNKIEKDIEKSQQEIRSFIAQLGSKRDAAIKDLTLKIKEKVLN